MPKSTPIVGDVVVTKATGQYDVGRVTANVDHVAAIAVVDDRIEALKVACRSASAGQRVFLYDQPGSRTFVEIECAKLLPATMTGKP